MDIQLKKGNLDLCVLHILYKKDSYGYEIASVISKYLDIGEITIYPILRKMQSEDLLGYYLKESNDGPPRKYYKITDYGKARYKVMKEEWEQFNNSIKQLMEEN